MAGVLGKFMKAPDERLEYSINYSDWLDDGETLTDVVFTVTPEGLVTASDPVVIDSHTIGGAGLQVGFFVAGGDDGEIYNVKVQATTTNGQIKDDKVVFVVRVV